ncbi:ANKIB1 [Mytilus edulis]|uniref:RBR-type E3 ubiquitin transferase n=1 Tax=Mytilus edulis TaxID=6550 RepID=A0A8S3TA90_MYTED|nr:ANKIB1 [Mytilus edulis]
MSKEVGQDFAIQTFDQQLYAVSQQVKWSMPEVFQSHILRLGGFHTLSCFIACIGKLWADGGLRDLMVDSGVYAGCTVDQMLLGKQFNRSVRGLTLVYEALRSLWFASFFKWCEENDGIDAIPKDVWVMLSKCQAKFSDESESYKDVLNELTILYTTHVLPLTFRKHLSNGDEYAALNQYNNSSELRKALDPNSSYGDSHNHETPLHYASKFAMKSLLRIFLSEHNGNPNKTNGMKQTCLHCVCMEKAEHSLVYPVMKKRSECLAMLLKWRGARLEDNETERVNLGAQDEEQNTALHYAALSGLKQCVEMLVQHGAPLFQENCDNQTPCDSAEKGGHADIALYLESKMVFSADGPELDDEDMYIMPDSEEYNGLRAQDLQEAKDQLLVETADMLSVPLFTAEALLRNHGMEMKLFFMQNFNLRMVREILLEAWMTDPKACCEKSGVIPPPSVYSEQPHVQHSLSSIEPVMTSQHDVECDICTSSFITNEDPVQMACLHQFCKDCWQIYLDLKIQEGEAHNITCPAYDCMKLVSVEVIESVVSRAMARRYLQFDIKAFVESNPNIKWCPYPGCDKLLRCQRLTLSYRVTHLKQWIVGRAISSAECLGEAHEPASCENWKKWYNKIAEIRPEECELSPLQ